MASSEQTSPVADAPTASLQNEASAEPKGPEEGGYGGTATTESAAAALPLQLSKMLGDAAPKVADFCEKKNLRFFEKAQLFLGARHPLERGDPRRHVGRKRSRAHVLGVEFCARGWHENPTPLPRRYQKV